MFIVTGASSGVGLELAYILYLKNAKVYLAARSPEKAEKAITTIKSRVQDSNGSLHYLHLDLDDLTTITSSAKAFLKENDRLDVLWNNAGVMMPAQGSKTTQGYELQLGTNNVASFLFTKLLQPMLSETAKKAPADTVRVVWVSSNAAEHLSPKGGVVLDNLDYHDDKSKAMKYGISKAGNIYHGSEFARRFGKDGILSLSLNPGGLRTELTRHLPAWQYYILQYLLYEPIFGAYTEIYAGLSPEITASQNGAFVAPWGWVKGLRKDLELAQKPEAEGGSGIASKFWQWTEEQVKAYT